MRAQEFVDEDLTRRGFLRGLGAAAAVGATGGAKAGPWITNSQQDPMDNSISKSNTIKSTDGSAYLKVNDNKSVSFFVTNNMMMQASERTDYGPALKYRIKMDNDLRTGTGYVFGAKRSGFILTLGGEYSSELGNKLLNFNGIVKIEVPVYPDQRKIFEFEIGNLKKENFQQGVAEGAVEDLEKDLDDPKSYSAIDHMMQTIARDHGITGRQLHDKFVTKHGVIPDKWTRDQLRELNFLGSECTKDCSGHRAGYDWSKRKGLRQANSWSPSFNKGAGLAVAGK